jgi:lysophospholipase L1-like esterase
VKHVLCFGDSNTWGTKDLQDSFPDRFDLKVRWTGQLATTFGGVARILEEGMPGRTTVFDDALGDYRSGRHYLVPCLNSHRPLDLVVLMLGTNDLQIRFSAASTDIARGMEILVDMVQKGCAGQLGGMPQILIVTPPPLGMIDPVEQPSWVGAHQKCLELPGLYEKITSRFDCHYFNSQSVVRTADLGRDGIHLAATGHSILGKHLAEKVKEILAV